MKKGLLTSSRGFTLIELLVVIAIIGILSGIVLVNLRSSQTKARDARRLSDINALVTALNLYYTDNKNYPTTLSNLVPNQLTAVPVDQSSSSTQYSYAALGSDTDCNGYHLGATLENETADALNTDADSSGGTVCEGSADDFDGAEALVYDVKY